MAQQTLDRYWARKVRSFGFFIARSDIPHAPARVIGERRLKEMIADPNQIAGCVSAGADDERGSVLAHLTLALQSLHQAGWAGTNRESGFGENVLEGSLRLRTHLAQRTGHGRRLVSQRFFWMALRAPLVSSACNYGKGQDRPDPHCFGI